MATGLDRYQRKRNFRATPEPKGRARRKIRGALSFVIQKHAASHLHYDFRLELDGTLKSWAIPKGPSLDPAAKRLALQVEDHPLEYADFEGTIPAGNYGAGTVMVWDRGEWIPQDDPAAGLARGKLEFELRGAKLAGRWVLVKTRGRDRREQQSAWLLIKERDDEARATADFDVVEALPDSVLAGGAGRAWRSNRASHERAPPRAPSRRAAKAKSGRGAAMPKDAVAAPLPLSAAKVAPPGKSAARAQAGKADLATIEITHGDRVIDPASGFTKRDLFDFYRRMAPLLLPHLRERPVSLVRAPQGIDGQLFFQKHLGSVRIRHVAEVDTGFFPGHPPLILVDSELALQSCAQMNVIEFHTWNASLGDGAHPDRMVFDLDPGEGVAWKQVQDGARLMKGMLDQLHLKSFLKTSGGKGLHVVAPLQPRYDWDAVKDFSAAIVRHLAQTLPTLFVARSGPRNRVGRIFIDYLRNGLGATTVCAFSVRARPRLGVSIPLDWDELAGLRASDHWTVANAEERMDKAYREVWSGYARSAQKLERAMRALGYAAGGR